MRFHQLLGRTDLMLDEVEQALRDAGSSSLAGRWTFQVVEEFDDGYWSLFRSHERDLREALMKGRRHVHEAEMKERRRTEGRAGHESRPDEPAFSSARRG